MTMRKHKPAAAAPAKAPTDLTLGPKEAAKVFGRSTSWMHGLIAAGFVGPGIKGRYNLQAIARGVVGHFEAALTRATKTASDNKVKDARAREIELRIAERERKLVPLESALGLINEICGLVRQNLDGLAARCTRDLELRRTIEKETDAALVRIAEAIERHGRVL